MRKSNLEDILNYIAFLLPRPTAMSSMTNSYIWIANALNIDGLYFKTFQLLVQAVIKPIAVLTGTITAGIVRGLFTSSLIISVGLLCCTSFHPNGIFWLGLIFKLFYVFKPRSNHRNGHQKP